MVRCLNVKYSSYYVAMIYIVSKCAFLVNVLCQTHLLNRYLIPNAANNFGYQAWRDLWYGNRTWQDSGLFPRVTMCDFEVGPSRLSPNVFARCARWARPRCTRCSACCC